MKALTPKILVAEDDSFSANTYRKHLEDSGYTTMIARDGRQTLELVDSFQPKLIILDLILPTLDGFAILKLLHSKKTLSKIPIIVISDLDQSGDIQQCLDLGAKLFITKTSIDYPKLIQTIDQILALPVHPFAKS